MAESLIPLHVLNKCDHNSGFYGVGKKTIMDRVEKSSEAHNLLKSCGTTLPVTQEIIDDLQKFVIRYIYHDTKHKTLAEVRATKWSVLKKKKIIRLTPDLTVYSHTWSAPITSHTYRRTSSFRFIHHQLAMAGTL